MDRKKALQLHARMQKLLEEYTEDLDQGYRVVISKKKYSHNSISFGVEILEEGAETVGDMWLKQEVSRLGLVMENDHYKLVDYRPRSYKYPFIVENKKDGKTYKFSEFHVKTHLSA